MSENTQLLEAVRKEAKPGLWSRGVSLARDGAVALQSRTASEIELRVKVTGRAVAFTVVLYPGDEAWECDCPSPVDPCEHVVAGAISLDKAEKQDAPLEAVAERWSRVVYRFTRVEGGLQLHRVLAHADGTEEPLEDLTGRIAKPQGGVTLQVEQVDLVMERLLERRTRGPLLAEKLDALLRALEPARNVLLDGRPVAVSSEVLPPRAKVEDRGQQWVLTITADPRITEVVSPGVALTAESLVRLGETAMTGAWLQHLPLVRTYSPEIGRASCRERVL